MAIDSDYVNQMATKLATFEVQTAEDRATAKQTSYQSQLDAINELSSVLKTFPTSISALNSSSSDSMLVNSATFGTDGYASASVDASAVSGSYEFFVEQLATGHQVALQGVGDGDIAASGTLQIGQGDAGFSIDLASADADGDGLVSLSELSKAINGADDNSGVSSTLVRSNGEVMLVLAAEQTGAANAMEFSLSGASGSALEQALANPLELSPAQDAKVRLGGENGVLLSNSSNTFEDIIDGVSLTFTKAHSSGDEPLQLSVEQDLSATQEKVQSFIDAFNTLLSSFDSLTSSGSDSSERGLLASDAGVRSIENMLNQVVRQAFGGRSLIEYGIQADRDGKLTLDSTRFEKALAADPDGFDQLFTGKDNLLDTLDKNVAAYTSGTGLLTNRGDVLSDQLSKVEDQFDALQRQYDMYYARYLRQYTSLMQTQLAMEQTSGLFT